MDRQKRIRAILASWKKQAYDEILPKLHPDVTYIVGEGAANSICYTPGIFVGRSRVEQWYASHLLQPSVYSKSGILCATRPPYVNTLSTFEDSKQNLVTAAGFVGTNEGELPCMWMSLWRFRGDLVDLMILAADGVDGVRRFAAARHQTFVDANAAEFDRMKSTVESLGGHNVEISATLDAEKRGGAQVRL